MKKIILFLISITAVSLYAQKVRMDVAPETGGITRITIDGDPSGMNWIVSPDGRQYEWIGREWGWGLGSVRLDNEKTVAWTVADRVGRTGSVYHIDGRVELNVARFCHGDDLVEQYIFKNISSKSIFLNEMEINTPFNDNYPDAATCVSHRCHAHIWAGGNAAYVYALRMGGAAPHLGLMLTRGSLDGYVIKERDSRKGMSNTRGIICLAPSDRRLAPGESDTIEWRLFAHAGEQDFYAKLLAYGGIVAGADRYVAEAGDKVRLRADARTAEACARLMNGRFYVDGRAIKTVYRDGMLTADYKVDRIGHIGVECRYADGMGTRIELLGTCNVNDLIARRADFIVSHQQYDCPGDPRDGALLPYDNETGTLYLNWMKGNKRSDLSEGRERVGMGIFLAKQCWRTKDRRLRDALVKYARFVRTAIQDPDYKTWSEWDRKSKHRIYNYPWVAHFYFETFMATGNKQYLTDGYRTQMAAYRAGGYGFYTIDVPVVQSLELLRKNGMTAEADTLLGEYRKAADVYIANGVNYPKFEVNYEQSIVAPSVDFICEMYLVTGEQRYLDAARRLLPVVEAFGGNQPSYHLNNIAIRHWDGFWFGKHRYWGDTMPHYWSCITADCYANYSLCTGDRSYMERARTILEGNLCLFTEEGRGGCAWIYPTRVNGQTAGFLDPMANDQDFALMYYLKWCDYFK